MLVPSFATGTLTLVQLESTNPISTYLTAILGSQRLTAACCGSARITDPSIPSHPSSVAVAGDMARSYLRPAEFNHQTLQPLGSFWRPLEWRDVKRFEHCLGSDPFDAVTPELAASVLRPKGQMVLWSHGLLGCQGLLIGDASHHHTITPSRLSACTHPDCSALLIEWSA
jgi:hypothetical protein